MAIKDYFEYHNLKKYSLVAILLFAVFIGWSLKDVPKDFQFHTEEVEMEKCRNQSEISLEDCFNQIKGGK